MWGEPPIIKIYEALGAVADGRLHVVENSAKCYSSSGNKYYEVTYDPKTFAIMANDNGSYWKGYLGYPAIAFLLQTGVLYYRSDLANLLKGIAWKDINQKFKNDFDKTLLFIMDSVDAEQRDDLQTYAFETLNSVKNLNLKLLGKKTLPPEGY